MKIKNENWLGVGGSIGLIFFGLPIFIIKKCIFEGVSLTVLDTALGLMISFLGLAFLFIVFTIIKDERIKELEEKLKQFKNTKVKKVKQKENNSNDNETEWLIYLVGLIIGLANTLGIIFSLLFYYFSGELFASLIFLIVFNLTMNLLFVFGIIRKRKWKKKEINNMKY